MLDDEVTADIVSVDNTRKWYKMITFAITFPLTKLRDELQKLNTSTVVTRSFEIVNYIDEKKYAELDKDLKFNVMIQFEGLKTVTFFILPSESERVIGVNIHLRLDSHIKWPSLAVSYNRNQSYSSEKWYQVPLLDVEHAEHIFRKTLNQDIDNGKLCFIAEINIHNKGLKKCVPKKDIKIETSPSSFTEDVHNLLNDSTSSDVTLKSVDGAAWPAHKLILSARSAVFKAHFEHGTMESSTDVIETTFDTEVLQKLLHYIYTDAAPNCDAMDDAMKLHAAADYYQLNRLKSFCEIAMLSKLTVENAVETLVQADLYSANILKESILEFINKGENKVAVFKTDGWKTLQSVELIKLVCESSLK